MLRYILFDLDLFADESSRQNSQKRVLVLLEALTLCNQFYLEENPHTPLLYQLADQGKVKYKLPAQFDPQTNPEAAKVAEWLKQTNAPSQVTDAFLRNQKNFDKIINGETFRDIPQIIANGGGDCFPLTQKIIVRSRSTKQYELLALGELRHAYPAYEALSYNFSKGEYEFKAILGFVDKGVKKVSRARLSNGTDLVATDDHKFWSIDGSGANHKRLGVRTMGEYVEIYQDFKKGKISKSKRGDHSRILQAAKIPALSVVQPSQAQAYLAGMYAAEGEFDGKHTRIGQHKMPTRVKIEAALSAEGTSFHYQPGRGRTPGSGAQYNVHGGRSNHLVAMMRGQGLNSFDKRLPQAFLSGDEQTVSRMLEGHGDGDAWRPANGTYKRPNIDAIYATSSDELMEQLRLGDLILGRPTYAYQYQDHQGEGNQPIWRLHEYNDQATKLRARADLLKEDLPGMRYATVRNAEPFGEAHVGCIEVKDNHNFLLADGTLASNCDNLGAMRAAEIRHHLGVAAKPYITWRKRPDGGVTYHVIVIWPDGSSEDPSLLCGMQKDDGGVALAEEQRKLGERAGEMLAALRLPKAERIVGELERRVRLREAVGLILRGAR